MAEPVGSVEPPLVAVDTPDKELLLGERVAGCNSCNSAIVVALEAVRPLPVSNKCSFEATRTQNLGIC